MKDAAAIVPPGEIRDQVILPTSVAFGICLRGIKARLGRSLITLSGVILGIAFLMAVMYGQHIKAAMAAHAERLREVERRVAALRGEIGWLREKAVLVIADEPDECDRAFSNALAQQHGVRLTIWNIGHEGDAPTAEAKHQAAAVIVLGGAQLRLAAANLSPFLEAEEMAKQGKPILMFTPPPPSLAEALARVSVPIKSMLWEKRPEDNEREAQQETARRARMGWLITVSLGITMIGIANAMLMSVTERFREIGTMKCLGALSTFVIKLFLIESALVGLVGAICGVALGALFAILTYSWSYGLMVVLGAISYLTLASMAGQCLAGGMVLAMAAGIYPAWLASKMIPAVALSSHV